MSFHEFFKRFVADYVLMITRNITLIIVANVYYLVYLIHIGKNPSNFIP